MAVKKKVKGSQNEMVVALNLGTTYSLNDKLYEAGVPVTVSLDAGKELLTLKNDYGVFFFVEVDESESTTEEVSVSAMGEDTAIAVDQAPVAVEEPLDTVAI